MKGFKGVVFIGDSEAGEYGSLSLWAVEGGRRGAIWNRKTPTGPDRRSRPETRTEHSSDL